MRANYHHGDLPRALVEAALRLIAAHGVDGFSLRAAAREAGVNPAAVYRHFADRSALLGAVAGTGFAQLAEQMAAAMATVDGAERRFLATGSAYVRYAVANPEYFRVMFGPYGSGRGDSDSGSDASDLLVDALRGLAPHGTLPDGMERAALTAWSAVHGLSALLVDRAVVMTEAEVDRAVTHLTTSVLRGLVGPPSSCG